MAFSLRAVFATIIIMALLVGGMAGQARPGTQKQDGDRNRPTPAQKGKPAPTPPVPAQSPANAQPPAEEAETGDDRQQDDIETVKVQTNLVTVPVVVSDRNDKYLPDMRQEEFTIYEDDVKQTVAFFATVTAPFNVVLMLDTSASTQEKLGQIQRAAIDFVEQLQAADRVKVISFDDQIRELSDFTEARPALQAAIRQTRPGKGTKLYDAMHLALGALKRIKGRKAIVIFTDGVDSYSDRENYDKNRRELEEAGIIVYPIRYDTREDVERLVRQQQSSGQTIDLGTILGGGGRRGSTPPTFPGGSSIPLPSGPAPSGGTIKIPGMPDSIVLTGNGGGGGGINRSDRYPDTRDRDARYPGGRDPGAPDSRDPNSRYPGGSNNPMPGSSGRGGGSIISSELDMMYSTADAYLNDLAELSGGTLLRADTLFFLPDAFARIAAELRTQYSLGYYPTRTERDGKYRKIKVKSTRKDAVVRARPGYRAPRESK
ncbi:MAG TPA: VWA domain-containing protein [Pyrinomonadaceae bacterium]|jgi:Mg-chelatase subunit ChlD